LLHTLRTQLDLFQKVIGPLSRPYPRADYTADLFMDKIAGFLEQVGIEQAVLVGESIGATISLGLAARRHPRVRAVVAISTYDYDRGRGAKRGSALGWLLFSLNDRLRAMPEWIAWEMYRVGNRPGHYRAFMSLVHHWPTWEAVRERYGDIDRPVLLLYGDHDWSRPHERAETARRIPDAEMRTVANAGHFLSYDAPEETIERVVEFVERLPGTSAAGRFTM
jgi:pimeloyl-ACP methyl ester carboxylesterase